MIFIPGQIINILTFPGVMIHELAHQIFCRLFNVPVYEVKYFGLKRPSGYVIHERTESPLVTFFISVGPFILNTLVGALLLLPASVKMIAFDGYRTLGEDLSGNFFEFFPLALISWFGISVLMHAFPSVKDTENMVDGILKNPDTNIFAKILAAPVIGLMFLGAIGSAVWLDLGYALAVGYLLPKIAVIFIR